MPLRTDVDLDKVKDTASRAARYIKPVSLPTAGPTLPSALSTFQPGRNHLTMPDVTPAQIRPYAMPLRTDVDQKRVQNTVNRVTGTIPAASLPAADRAALERAGFDFTADANLTPAQIIRKYSVLAVLPGISADTRSELAAQGRRTLSQFAKEQNRWSVFDYLKPRRGEATPEEQQAAAELVERLFGQTKAGAGMTAAANAMSFGTIKNFPLGEDIKGVSGLTRRETVEQAEAMQPGAAAVGSTAGEIAKMLATGGIIGDAVQGIPIVQKVPALGRILSSGLTFGAVSGLNTAGAGGTLGESLKNAGIGFAGGAAGGAASEAVGGLVGAGLSKIGLQNSIPTAVVERGLQGAGFAAGNTGATYFLLPEDSRPTKEQIVQDAAVAGLYASIMGLIEIPGMVRADRARLERGMQTMRGDFEKYSYALNSAASDTERVAMLDSIIQNNRRLGEALKSGRFLGQQETVNQICSALDQMNGVLAEMKAGLSVTPLLPAGTAGGAAPPSPAPMLPTAGVAGALLPGGASVSEPPRMEPTQTPAIPLPPPVQTGAAVWHGAGQDQPVEVTGYAGSYGGKRYVTIAGSETAIPQDQVTYLPTAQDGPTAAPRVLPTATGTQAKQVSGEIVSKLRKSIPRIREMQPVLTITGEEFPKSEKKLTEQVGEFFDSLGNKVHREGFGDVILDERGVKDSIAHGIGRRKAAAFVAVPDIIERGTQIDFQSDWKQRGYDSYVFAAPILVGDGERAVRNYVAAVVTKMSDNRYYLHEVVDENGNLIFSTKKGTGDTIKTDLLPKGSIGGSPVPVKPIISDPSGKINAGGTAKEENIHKMQDYNLPKTDMRSDVNSLTTGLNSPSGTDGQASGRVIAPRGGEGPMSTPRVERYNETPDDGRAESLGNNLCVEYGRAAGYNHDGGGINANDTGGAAGSLDQNDGKLAWRKGEPGAGSAQTGGTIGRRTFQEPAGTFLARTASEGKVVEADERGNIIAYKPAEKLTENAAEARKILSRRGFETFGYEGSLERSRNGMTTEHLTDAQTLPDGRIGLKNGAKIPGREIAGHEGFHSITVTAPEVGQPFLELISSPTTPEKAAKLNENIDFMGDLMFGEGYNPAIVSQRANIIKELGAQIGGKIDFDLELAHDLFADILDDFDQAVAIWKKVNADFDALHARRRGSGGGPRGGAFPLATAPRGGEGPMPSPRVERYSDAMPENDSGYGPHSIGAAESSSPKKQKVSQLYDNTFQKTPLFTQAEKNLANSQNMQLGYQYDVIGEKQSLKEAAQRLQVDYMGELEDLPKKERFDGVDTDTAVMILRNMTEEARNTGDWSEVKRWSKMIQERGTEAGQRIQAFAKYSRTPEGTVVKAQKAIQDNLDRLAKQDQRLVDAMDDLAGRLSEIAEEYEHELPSDPAETAKKLRKAIDDLGKEKAYKLLDLDEEFTDHIIKALQEGRNGKDTFAEVIQEFEGIPTLTNDDIMNIMDIMTEAENLPQYSKARLEIENRAYKIIADKFETTFMEKWNAWRYMAMLGNFRTHARNIVGNELFGMVTSIKNDVAALLETGIDKGSHALGGKGIPRTKALLNPLDPSDIILERAARLDFDNIYALIMGGGKYNPSNMIRDNRTIFKTRWLEAARKANFSLLELEDEHALRKRYIENVSRFIKANGYDAQIFQSQDERAVATLDAARAHAIKEAQKATFRDYSALAAKINGLSNTGVLANVLVEGLLPFKKTPINILKRGVEYSPIGLARGLAHLVKSIKHRPSGAADAINEFAAGLTGSGIMLLGLFLAAKGLLTAGGSDNRKERNFASMQGRQDYALTVGGRSYTLDWAAPAALPLFVGVEVWDAMHEKDGDLSLWDILDATERVSDPMIDMSMLQGLNSAIQSAAYSNSNAISSIAGTVAANYFGQAVPTLSGQVTRTLDGTRRRTYVDPTINLPDWTQMFAQKTAAKLPWFSSYLQPYVDAWGRENEEKPIAQRAFENFLSPGYFSTERITPADEAIKELYDATGDASILPGNAPKSFRVDGEKVLMTGAQYTEYAKTRGQAANLLVEAIAKNDLYQGFADEDKVSAIKRAYDYANAIAKAKVSDYEPDGWIAAAQEAAEKGIPVDAYIVYRSIVDADGNGSVTQQEAARAIEKVGKVAGLTPAQKHTMFRLQNSAWKKNPF